MVQREVLGAYATVREVGESSGSRKGGGRVVVMKVRGVRRRRWNE